MAILSKGCKPGNFQSHNPIKLNYKIFKATVQILLNVNLFLNQMNQTVMTFWLYVRQTWMTQLILAICP